jgi:hypothetical protein
MSDPISEASRAAAEVLAAEFGPSLPANVEEALYARDVGHNRPMQYPVDSVAIGGLIVSIATLAWTVYTDQRKHTDEPSPESVARQVHVTQHERGDPATPEAERITEVVVTEVIQAARHQQ